MGVLTQQRLIPYTAKADWAHWWSSESTLVLRPNQILCDDGLLTKSVRQTQDSVLENDGAKVP